MVCGAAGKRFFMMIWFHGEGAKQKIGQELSDYIRREPVQLPTP
jgi:hypothetical protein